MTDIFSTPNTTRKFDLYEGKGYVELLNMSPRIVKEGDTADRAIAAAARISYLSESKKLSDDIRLVKRLYRDQHTSPFEMVEFQFRIRMPIFVERQLVRHRTASLNSQSGRYTKYEEGYYYPELRLQSTTNKQGSEEGKVSEEAIKIWGEIEEMTKTMYDKYEQLVDMNVSRELARCCLPVSFMTEMIWKMDLHNLLKFLRLRMDPHAQKEIQDLAYAIYNIIKQFVPAVCEAFEEYHTDLFKK